MLSNKLEKLYLWGIKAFVFLIPFVSLYISGSMTYPYMTGKNFSFRILVEVAAVLWLGLAVLNKRYRLRNSAMLLLVLAFTFITGLAYIGGVNPYNSLWSNYERMDGYLTILHLCLYFMIIKSVFKARMDWLIFLNIIALVSLLINVDTLFNILRHKYSLVNGIYPLLQKVGYLGTNDSTFFRPSGRMGNDAFFASYLVLAIVVKMILTFNFRQLWVRIIYLSAVVFDLLFIYFTATRGAMLAIVVGIISFCLISIFVKSKTSEDRLFRKIAISILCAISVLSAVFFMVRDTDFIKKSPALSRISQISLSEDTTGEVWFLSEDPSTQARIISWQMAWEGVKERPILGWGQENFPHVYTKYFNPKIYGLDKWLDRSHNTVFDWLVNAGFLGLISYLSFFVAVFLSLWSARKKKIISTTGVAVVSSAIIAYFFQNLFVFDTINTYIIFFTLLAYTDGLSAAKVSVKQENGTNEIEGSRKAGGSRASGFFNAKIRSVCAAVLALLILGYIAYFINYKPIKQSKLLTRLAASRTGYGSFSAALDDYRKALACNTFGDKHVAGQMALISDSILKTKSLSMGGASKFIDATVVELEKHVAADPNNLENLYPLVTLLNNMAQYDASFIKKAEVYIKECLRLSPKNQWVYFVLADNYVLKKDYENAFVSVKKAVDLDPEKDESQFKLAMTAILASHPPAGRAGGSSTKYDIAEEALENVRKIRLGKDSDLPDGQAGADLERKSVFKITELYALAVVSVEIKDYPLALRFYKEIIAVSPENAKYHFEIAGIYFALGDKANAMKHAEKAKEIDPSNYSEAVKNFINSKSK